MRRSSRAPKGTDKASALIVKMATEGSKEPLLAREAVSQYLATIGRQGGIKGGKARAEKLSPERRQEIARFAAQSRWANKERRCEK